MNIPPNLDSGRPDLSVPVRPATWLTQAPAATVEANLAGQLTALRNGIPESDAVGRRLMARLDAALTPNRENPGSIYLDVNNGVTNPFARHLLERRNEYVSQRVASENQARAGQGRGTLGVAEVERFQSDAIRDFTTHEVPRLRTQLAADTLNAYAHRNDAPPPNLSGIGSGLAAGGVMGLFNGGIINTLMGGVMGMINNFISGLPWVTDRMSALGAWANSRMGGMLSSMGLAAPSGNQGPLSWDQAMAQAQNNRVQGRLSTALGNRVNPEQFGRFMSEVRDGPPAPPPAAVVASLAGLAVPGMSIPISLFPATSVLPPLPTGTGTGAVNGR